MYCLWKSIQGGVPLGPRVLWKKYTERKQIYLQLAVKYGYSTKTIQRKLDTIETVKESTFSGKVNVLMDTTYLGKKFDVMVFKDSFSEQILYKQYVKQETNKCICLALKK